MLPRSKRFSIVLLVIVIMTVTAAWKNREGQSSSLAVTFHHKVGGKDLVLFDETYTNAFNEPFSINKFRYYISNVEFVDKDGKKKILKDFYHLVDEADSASKRIIFNTSGLQQVVSIEFLLGVDSIKNTSGVQTGDLDPMKGMFWTWNSGYVYAKLEGQSDSSHAPLKYFNFDVGGYKPKENAVRKIKLNINIQSLPTRGIVIDVDVSKWFNAVHPIHINQTPICHQPGDLAMQLADNYATMFSIGEVKQ